MGKTKIEWATDTWSPVSGCSKVSPGCTNCYAIRETNRHRNLPKYAGLVTRYPDFLGDGPLEWTREVRCHPELLDQPLHWKKPRMIFVCSMSDLFHDKVPWEFIVKVFDVMAATPWHTYQVLTKRPGRMAHFAEHIWPRHLGPCKGWSPGAAWPPNVWAGTSLEQEWDGQKHLVRRLDCLLRVPAKVRFVSAEPLLGPLDLKPYFFKCSGCVPTPEDPICACKGLAINWVIIGGESGPGARPMDLAWARSLVGQCQVSGVPCFVKQLGRNPTDSELLWDSVDGKGRLLWDAKGGDMTAWPHDLRVRQMPQ